MAKIKQWWNTPITKIGDDKDHIKYTIIAVVIVVAIIGLVLLFIWSGSLNTTTNAGTYTEQPVETTVSQSNQNVNVLQTNETGPLDMVINNGSILIGNVPITTVLIILVISTVIGSFLRRQMKWIMFLMLQGFCFIMFGVSIWTVLIPVMYIIMSFILGSNRHGIFY